METYHDRIPCRLHQLDYRVELLVLPPSYHGDSFHRSTTRPRVLLPWLVLVAACCMQHRSFTTHLEIIMNLTNKTKAELILIIEGKSEDAAKIADLETRISKARELYRAQKSEIDGLQTLLENTNPSRYTKVKRVLTGAAAEASARVKSRASKIAEASAVVKDLIRNAASAEQVAAAKERVREAIAE